MENITNYCFHCSNQINPKGFETDCPELRKIFTCDKCGLVHLQVFEEFFFLVPHQDDAGNVCFWVDGRLLKKVIRQEKHDAV